MKIITASLDDIPRLQQFRTDAAAWLTARGSDQWSTPYPEDLLHKSIVAGHVYLIFCESSQDPEATVTVDSKADPALWRPEEVLEPALYVHKLTLAQPGRRGGLGARILDWCGDRGARSGARWLRLDAWTTNTGLHRYYQHQGFEHVRTVYAADAFGSGWVAQRPTRRVESALFEEL
ncbi:GNAT family N-acetyltransferase [Streptomyces sp. H10-C2]|uniref:GNAT family N-acetyltransferase n=1 Tax=unclassified Streptomyces TaxID=2593676 RepID=UPI0024BB052C|nr:MULTISPECIES: GNAT family N-acetyltransferase [unclassified Streptomyces]MDJ0342798.1 GNAT family N-acetyltransferase [Streptomyces sp. PH10-H1]MDJ0372476.1 GNAT family N-acetyltransferase [Streptomyces sp. H10-C2]